MTEKCRDRLLHLLSGLPVSSFQSQAFAFMRHAGPRRRNLKSAEKVLRSCDGTEALCSFGRVESQRYFVSVHVPKCYSKERYDRTCKLVKMSRLMI